MAMEPIEAAADFPTCTFKFWEGTGVTTVNFMEPHVSSGAPLQYFVGRMRAPGPYSFLLSVSE